MIIAAPARHSTATLRTLLILVISTLAACAPVAATSDGAATATTTRAASPTHESAPPPTTGDDDDEATEEAAEEESSRDDDGIPRERVTLGAETFRLELAVTGAQRAKGFMGRTTIPADGGMLFVYPDSNIRSMWMANCLVDMDIIFLDRTGRILTGYAMKAEPPKRDDESQWQYEARLPRYRSIRPAQFAIELKAGAVKRLGLKAGDRITLDLGKLKKLAK